MRPWKVLSTSVLTALLAVPPAYATTPVSPGDSSPTGRWAVTDEGTPVEVTDRAVVEGQVAAVDRESGRFIIETDSGLMRLITTPGELAGVEIGDVVRVALMDESD